MEAYIIKDRAGWESWLDGTPCDVYDHYDYVLLNCGIDETPELYIARHSEGMLIYPYIRRLIGTEYNDLVTPYGYGGPFRVGHFSDEDVEMARRLFLERSENIATVSETIRYHPVRVDPVIMASFGQFVPVRKTIQICLHEEYDVLQTKFHKMTKRNVKRAHRENVTLGRGDVSDLPLFMSLYEATMNRRQASEGYYFSEHYFKQLLTSESFESDLLFAYYDGQVIAGVLLLYSETGAHYHLGGSIKEYLSFRPNHFLFSEMIRHARDKQKAYLHLGGGATGEDALFDFKKSFSGEAPLTYWIGQAVLNHDVYDRLNSKHVRHHGPSDYFPMYRTPVPIENEVAKAE